MTSFDNIYNAFFGKITEDMYIEWTEEETKADIKSILIESLPLFEFPKFDITDFDDEGFNAELSAAEIDIIATIMVWAWIKRQTASCDNIRMKYSGSDFKMTSQANHLEKLLKLQEQWRYESHHAQRLYGRRERNKKGLYESTWKKLR